MFHKETATIFGDPLTITLEDPNHSKDNNRAIESGLSRQERFGLSLYRLLDPGRTKIAVKGKCLTRYLKSRRATLCMC